MGWFGRKRPIDAGTLTQTPDPRGSEVFANAPQWAGIAVAPGWTQVGRYALPPTTQRFARNPGPQLNCGVEGLRPWWYVQGVGDVPYFQQTARPVNPSMAQLNGGQVGTGLGPAQVSALLGPQRQAQAEQLQAVANGWLGW